MIGLDVPYVNLWFHRDCFNLHVTTNIDAYLLQNIDMVYNYIESNNKGKNRRLWAKNE